MTTRNRGFRAAGGVSLPREVRAQLGRRTVPAAAPVNALRVVAPPGPRHPRRARLVVSRASRPRTTPRRPAACRTDPGFGLSWPTGWVAPDVLVAPRVLLNVRAPAALSCSSPSCWPSTRIPTRPRLAVEGRPPPRPRRLFKRLQELPGAASDVTPFDREVVALERGGIGGDDCLHWPASTRASPIENGRLMVTSCCRPATAGPGRPSPNHEKAALGNVDQRQVDAAAT